MKHSLYLSTSLAAGAFLLAGSFALAQTTSAANNMHSRDAASGQSSGQQGQSGQANLKPGAGSSAVQYKDPEDMTTRYRPGNNKTTRSANDTAAQGAGAAQPQAMSRKHIAGVKYEDRTAGDNPGGTAGQSAQGNAQRKSGSIIAVDREGAAAQRKDGSIAHSDFPRSTGRNSAHATESLSSSNGGGSGARGMAVNEQGSSSAPVRRRR